MHIADEYSLLFIQVTEKTCGLCKCAYVKAHRCSWVDSIVLSGMFYDKVQKKGANNPLKSRLTRSKKMIDGPMSFVFLSHYLNTHLRYFKSFFSNN